MSKTVNIPIGPVHPALKEPVRFTIEVEGEKVVGADYEVGYVHRGIEWAGMRQNPIKTIHLSERICGICAFCHPLCFVQAIEEIGDVEVPERAEYIRVITAELERIHSHMLWAGVAAHEIGFDSILNLTWNIREKVMDIVEYITGNRVTYGMLQIGGVRRNITEKQYPKIREATQYYRELLDKIEDVFLRDPTIRMRSRDVGILTKKRALELCAVGPTTRASGVPKDVRQDFPYIAYPDLDVKAIMPEEPIGDVYDRIFVRIREIGQSADIIEQCLDQMEPGPILAEQNVAKLLADLQNFEGEAVGRAEAPRGEVFHYVRMNKNEAPLSWKARAPTYNNVQTWPDMIVGEELADVPIIVASIDPCVSCTDRVTLIKDGKEEIVTGEQLHKLSVLKTKRVMRR